MAKPKKKPAPRADRRLGSVSNFWIKQLGSEDPEAAREGAIELRKLAELRDRASERALRQQELELRSTMTPAPTAPESLDATIEKLRAELATKEGN
jgi:hypothetical protein